MGHAIFVSAQERIMQTTDADSLRKVREEIMEMLQGHPLFDHPLEWNSVLNQIHDELMKQAIRFAEKRTAAEGFGFALVPYCFVLFGSGGRMEQTLSSDQDNGIIYADPRTEIAERVQVYFEHFSSNIVEVLKEIGYPPCEGNVLCSHSLFCKPISGWFTSLQEWLNDRSWENVRYLLIMADARALEGQEELLHTLKQFYYQFLKGNPDALLDFMYNTRHRKVSLSVLGKLIRERYGEAAGGVDLKYGSYIPFINAIRLLSIAEGIDETSTQGRLRQLGERVFMDERWRTQLEHALQTNLKLRAQIPFAVEDGLYGNNGILLPDQLTKETVQELKACLRVGRQLEKGCASRLKKLKPNWK